MLFDLKNKLKKKDSIHYTEKEGKEIHKMFKKFKKVLETEADPSYLLTLEKREPGRPSILEGLENINDLTLEDFNRLIEKDVENERKRELDVKVKIFE